MPLPYYVHFEPTTRCNMSCSYCTRGTLGDENLKNDIDFKHVVELVASNPNLIEMHLQGLGEPLMAKNFETIVEFLYHKKIKLSTFTNGTTLLRNAGHRKLLLTKFSTLTLSIDTLEPALSNELREGGNIEDIVEGLKLLIEEKKAHKSKLHISVNIVITEKNLDSLENTIKTLHNLGVDHFGLNEQENLKAFGDLGWQTYHEEATTKRKRKPEIQAKIKNIDFSNISIYNTELMDSQPQKGNCDWGFYRIFVNSNGFVTPCCKRIEDNHKITQSPINQDFKSHWNSPDLTYFRKTHLSGLANRICDYCPN